MDSDRGITLKEYLYRRRRLRWKKGLHLYLTLRPFIYIFCATSVGFFLLTGLIVADDKAVCELKSACLSDTTYMIVRVTFSFFFAACCSIVYTNVFRR